MDRQLEHQALRATVARAGSGDPDAWEALYRHSYPRLLAYARRRLPTHEAADDAVSEAMMRAVRGIGGFSWSGGGYDAWMYGILRNVVLEANRAHGRQSRLNDRQAAQAGVQQQMPEPGPESLAESADDAARLRAAFELLGPDDREVLELRVVGGLSAEETATVLGKRAGAVRMAQSRALDRLRHALSEVASE